MNRQDQHDREEVENDPVWDLLAKDAAAHPLHISPWFAARTTSMVRDKVKERRFMLRWMLPIPFAGLAAVILTLHLTSMAPNQGRFVSSEEEFEQNMELLVGNE